MQKNVGVARLAASCWAVGALLALSLLSPRDVSAQEPVVQATQTCWCFGWVHGPDFGRDCFMTPGVCEQRRGEAGRRATDACETEEQVACERTGVVNGRRLNLGPTRPRAATLLGMSRRHIRRALGGRTAVENGWRRYGPAIAIQFVGGRVARVRLRVQSASSCAEAVLREGFQDATAPLRLATQCEWPGLSMRHRLEPSGRVAGAINLRSGTLEVWFRD